MLYSNGNQNFKKEVTNVTELYIVEFKFRLSDAPLVARCNISAL